MAPQTIDKEQYMSFAMAAIQRCGTPVQQHKSDLRLCALQH